MVGLDHSSRFLSCERTRMLKSLSLYREDSLLRFLPSCLQPLQQQARQSTWPYANGDHVASSPYINGSVRVWIVCARKRVSLRFVHSACLSSVGSVRELRAHACRPCVRFVYRACDLFAPPRVWFDGRPSCTRCRWPVSHARALPHVRRCKGNDRKPR